MPLTWIPYLSVDAKIVNTLAFLYWFTFYPQLNYIVLNLYVFLSKVKFSHYLLTPTSFLG